MNNTHFISTSASFKSESPYVADALISMFLGFLVGIIGIYSCVHTEYQSVRCPRGSKR
jgi:hypothetical protein